jgi:hypothetical protein
MMKLKSLTNEQLLHAIRTGEFGSDVTASRQKVAVVMTQDWCSDWMRMESWLGNTADCDDVDIYLVVYNTLDCFQDFLRLKENQWRNDHIPYVRYYENGSLFRVSNAVSREAFSRFFGLSL